MSGKEFLAMAIIAGLANEDAISGREHFARMILAGLEGNNEELVIAEAVESGTTVSLGELLEVIEALLLAAEPHVGGRTVDQIRIGTYRAIYGHEPTEAQLRARIEIARRKRTAIT